MQNGVSTEDLAAARFGRVYGGMVFWPLACPEPGCVHVHSECGVVDVGCHPTGLDAEAENVAADLRAAGIDSRADSNILRTKYGKLLLNLANALEALAGRAARSSTIRQRVIAEAIDCYQAARIDFLPVDALLERVAEVKDLPVAGKRRAGGSMWQSLARHSGTIESAFLNGAIVELGTRHGVPTPLNRGLLALSERAAREAWPPGKLTVDELEHALQ
jgi:2-dehydropantoate 2-reductase